VIFSFTEYQVIKIKWCYKKIDFFVGVHCPRTDSKLWPLLEQKLKKEKIKYYKPSSTSYSRVLQKSTFLNFSGYVGGTFLFLYFEKKDKHSVQKLQKFLEQNKIFLVPILIKLNNKKYQEIFLSKIFKSSYNDTAVSFLKTLDRSLKMTSLRSKNYK